VYKTLIQIPHPQTLVHARHQLLFLMYTISGVPETGPIY